MSWILIMVIASFDGISHSVTEVHTRAECIKIAEAAKMMMPANLYKIRYSCIEAE